MTDAAEGSAGHAAQVEQYADLHAYGLSLGIDLDVEGEEDLQWAVQEAFNAPLPNSWTEYMDDSGRAYYVKEGSSQSTWEHPMDEVYRELLQLIKQFRSQHPDALESQRLEVVRDHLKTAHQRAKNELAGWSGPYSSEQGDYYYHEVLKASSWECPVAEWETELKTRHDVLSRYLLPRQAPASGLDGGSQAADGEEYHVDLLQALRLQLGNLQRDNLAPEDVPFPSASRSFHTARSGCSSRSGRSGRSQYSRDHKERKERHGRGTTAATGESGDFTSVD
uniref:WW domain-containing protein n=2 Tax=Alexandrium monilatum TaxID=311494 RepID=A0A7S4QXG0_9DINO